MGLSIYAKCERSADCFFGGYCNFGRCVPTLELGALCNTHEACGRQALCLYSDSLSAFGVCTELLSVDADTLIMGKTKSGKYSKLNLSLFLYSISAGFRQGVQIILGETLEWHLWEGSYLEKCWQALSYKL